MDDQIKKGPEEEQAICVACGFCCDGTLFLHACLNPGERGHLPEKIEEKSFAEEGKDYFHLPCLYFSEKCTIYDRQRADVCSAYRCQLLKDLAGGIISPDEALSVVMDAKRMRDELLREYRKISGFSNKRVFRELLNELVRLTRDTKRNIDIRPGQDMLLVRCNIFEALLIKHIRSKDDFEKMMLK